MSHIFDCENSFDSDRCLDECVAEHSFAIEKKHPVGIPSFDFTRDLNGSALYSDELCERCNIRPDCFTHKFREIELKSINFGSDNKKIVKFSPIVKITKYVRRIEMETLVVFYLLSILFGLVHN